MTSGDMLGYAPESSVAIVTESVVLSAETWVMIAGLATETDAELLGWQAVLPGAEDGQLPTIPVELSPAFQGASPLNSSKKELFVVYKNHDSSRVVLFSEIIGVGVDPESDPIALSAFTLMVDASTPDRPVQILVGSPDDSELLLQEAVTQR